MKTGSLVVILVTIFTSVHAQNKSSTFQTDFTSIQEESEAMFPGGTPAMESFIYSHIKLSKDFKKKGHSGYVHVEFGIDSTGLIVNPKVIKPLGFGCDEEALRIVQIMPNWLPARRLGIPYASKYVLKIQFEVDGMDLTLGNTKIVESKKDAAVYDKIKHYIFRRLNSIYLEDKLIEKENLAEEDYYLGLILNKQGILFQPVNSTNMPSVLSQKIEKLFEDTKQFDIRTLGFDSLLICYCQLKVEANGIFPKGFGFFELKERDKHQDLMLDFYLKPFQKHRDTVIAASEELTRIAKLIDAKEFATAHEVLDKAIKEKGENINYTFLKAIAFSKEGDKKKACILFQLALKRGYTVGFSQTATKEKIEEYLLSSCSSE